GVGDACDNCTKVANAGQENADGDTRGDACDNCRIVANGGQQNADAVAIPARALHLAFDEGQEHRAHDDAAAWDAFLFGAATWHDGMSGSALALDGTT